MFPRRTFRVFDLTVETEHLGAGTGTPGSKEWNPADDPMDWYKVTVTGPEPGMRITNTYGGSPHAYEKGRDLSREFARHIVEDLGKIVENPDGYLEEETRGASPEDVERVEEWIGEALEFGELAVEAKDALKKGVRHAMYEVSGEPR
jgi:hypothetical protein